MRRVCTAFWAQRRVLLTGASGFIGGAVAQRLAAAGADVHGTGCTRAPPPGMSGHRVCLPQDADALLTEVRPSLVLHLASPVSMDTDDGAHTRLRRGIVEATDAIAQATAHAGAGLIHISSCAVYEGGTAPFHEGQSLSPSSPYGMLKREAEDRVMDHTAHGLKATIIRPFRTFGPGCTTGLVAEACRAAVTGAELSLTDGQQVREWNHIDAIAIGIIAAAQEPPSGNTWNLGGGDRVSVAGLARRIFSLARRRPEGIKIGAHARRPGEVDRFWGDHRRGDSRWGPLVPVDLDTGLQQTLTWHQARSAQ